MFSKEVKYVKVDDLRCVSLILFPKHINHSDIGKMIKSVYPGWKIESAGFANLISKKCYGRSESLNLESHEKDTFILRSQFV